MTNRKLAIVVLAAGLGTRMKSNLPKVMHTIAGMPMIEMVVTTLRHLSPDRIVVVIGEGMERVAATVAPHPTVIQHQRLGTGHAVMAARSGLDDFDGDVLIVYGDTPLIQAATFERLLAARRAKPAPAIAVLGFRPEDPAAYGRMIVSADGSLDAIVEAKDATAEQLTVTLCNSGVIAVDRRDLFRLVDQVGNNNAKQEYYLTDIIGIARREGLRCVAAEAADENELIGINPRADLARAEAFLQARLRDQAMAAGVTLIDPATTYLAIDTEFGRDVVIGPCVFFGPGVSVGNDVTIRSFSHLEGVTIAEGAQIGPFARLRPGAHIGPEVHVGNFVEIKNTTIERGAKVNHLTYLGDARVGRKANVGAGTITCNYDGFFKDHTDIGEGAFIGSNASLVAPVKIGAGAIVGAGSVITQDVADDTLALTRAPQAAKPGWAGQFRRRRGAEKAERASRSKE
jgi:bifunctional UDP-N-acetylglucosamine pyrophosphorylase/glucosamine-1-phosphate N-acetyltransferase